MRSWFRKLIEHTVCGMFGHGFDEGGAGGRCRRCMRLVASEPWQRRSLDYRDSDGRSAYGCDLVSRSLAASDLDDSVVAAIYQGPPRTVSPAERDAGGGEIPPPVFNEADSQELMHSFGGAISLGQRAALNAAMGAYDHESREVSPGVHEHTCSASDEPDSAKSPWTDSELGEHPRYQRLLVENGRLAKRAKELEQNVRAHGNEELAQALEAADENINVLIVSLNRTENLAEERLMQIVELQRLRFARYEADPEYRSEVEGRRGQPEEAREPCDCENPGRLMTSVRVRVVDRAHPLVGELGVVSEIDWSFPSVFVEIDYDGGEFPVKARFYPGQLERYDTLCHCWHPASFEARGNPSGSSGH